MMSSIIKKRGFTLVETLIYAAGTVLLLAVIVTALYYAYIWYGYATISPRVDQVGVSLADRLMSDIRAGVSVNAGSSSFGTNNGVLSLNVLTGTTTTATDVYALSNGQVTYQQNSGTVQYLTPANLYVTALSFTQLTTPVSMAVHFSISIAYSARGSTTTNTYAGVGILRNSY